MRLAIGPRRWVPDRRLARRTRGLVLGGLWLRLVTWARSSTLDRELAAGVDPLASDELSLRAGQLHSAKSRARLACGLRGAVNLSGRPFDPLVLRPSLIRRSEVSANVDLLLELADRVTATPVSAEGLARTSVLVADGSSPMYRGGARSPLRIAAFEALVALEHGPPATPDTAAWVT
jgi:hypothetical protein